jgi:assimilatory nitrate reductase catalytic subunit
LFEQVGPLMDAAPYAARTLVGRERPAVRLALAAERPPSSEVLARISALLPSSEPDARGRTICNCFDVAESEIDAFLAATKSLSALQSSLRCGTNCGSCLPELRRRVAA